jgi:hypothetical protein
VVELLLASIEFNPQQWKKKTFLGWSYSSGVECMPACLAFIRLWVQKKEEKKRTFILPDWIRALQ